MKWLGLYWDEGIDVGGENGPYRQTERLPLYNAAVQRLLEEGKLIIAIVQRMNWRKAERSS